MKNIISLLLLLMGFAFSLDAIQPETIASDPGGAITISIEDAMPANEAAVDQIVGSEIDNPPSLWDLIILNWEVVIFGLFGFAEVIVRLTPSEKDNSILNFLKKMFEFILPNLKVGGGKHIGK